jgi:hypothetical protein
MMMMIKKIGKKIFTKKMLVFVFGLSALAGSIAYPQYSTFVDKGVDIVIEAFQSDNETEVAAK